MAVTLVSNIVTISDADSTTGWNGNSLDTETDFYKEGTGCLSDQIATDPADIYYSMSATDLSNQHVRIWAMTNTFGYFTTSNSFQIYASDGTNTAYWTIADNALEYSGGWKNILIDLESTPTSGSVDTSIVNRIGLHFDYTSKPRRVVNTWLDYLRYGVGYTAYGTFSIEDVYVADSASGVGYGVIEKTDPVYFLFGTLIIGRTSEQTIYSESGTQMDFANATVSDTLYGIQVIGDTAVSSTFSWTGCIFATGSKSYYLDLDDSNIDTLTFTGNTVQGGGLIHFLASSTDATVTSNVFDSCNIIYPQGSKFEFNTIKGTTSSGTDGSLYITDTTTIDNMNNLTFSSYSGKYAIHIPASITGTISFDNYQFDGSGTDVYWAGTSGTLTINLTNGTNASTSSTGGGTVTFVASPVTTEITVLIAGTTTPIENARVYLECESGGPLPVNASVSISSSGTTATVTHTSHGYSTGNYVVIRGSNETEFRGSYSITVVDVDTYTYEMTEATTPTDQSATGSPVVTTVIFNTLTDSNGKVSDSRALSSDQPVSGRVRKNTSSPYYKSTPLVGPISNANGLLITAQMVPDE